ncbi:ABC transporter permease [Micromonospora sp. PLK6-60]|uniref:FtsX-like permease family protein n=1 Tax=Micromonospora sp. PLK6-60 TaxID=2873383 RepID=UPI001CA73347|nr:ABC transporter permease [Micromonospora sp. PLK6-60]MBY8871293.1 ABC transporter permease [Micromonospora sp. PLK6-60]
MLRTIWAQLRHSRGRTAGVLAAVLLATTGFVVLSGAATTSRLVASGTVDDRFRPPYDILVRPAGRPGGDLLQADQVVDPGGGISLAQWDRIRAVPGVEVAAPLAVLGVTDVTPRVRVDVTALVDRTAQQQLIKVAPLVRADRGLTRLAAAPLYVYVSRRPLVPLAELGERLVYADGTRVDPTRSGLECPGSGGAGPLEVSPGGTRRQICPTVVGSNDPDLRRTHVSPVRAFQLMPDGTFRAASIITLGQPVSDIPRTPRLEVDLPVVVPMTLAAIDPVAEDELLGLAGTVRAGRHLRPAEPPPGSRRLPVLAATEPGIDQQIEVGTARLADGYADAVTADTRAAWQRLDRAAGTTPHTTRYDLAQRYRDTVDAALAAPGTPLSAVSSVLRPGPPGPAEEPDADHRLAPAAPGPPPSLTEQSVDTWSYRSWFFGRTVRRDATPLPQPRLDDEWTLEPVGRFDPAAVGADDAHAGLANYRQAAPVGADARSRDLLGGRGLLPNDDPLGYPGRAPTLLTSLTAARPLLAADPGLARAPLGAVRVRVAGIDRFDAVARERVRMVADEIVRRTGLDVRILLGSSAVPATVQLPAAADGRPGLAVTELWTKQGVATQIVAAMDRKNLFLLGLLLVVCGFLVANAVSTAVRGRSRELAVLACVGWPAWRLAALVLAESATVGLLAGLTGAALAIPVAGLAGVRISAGTALLCVPVGVLLTAVASVAPAVRAARTRAAAVLHPAVVPARRATTSRTVLGLALTNLARVPARTAAGVGSLAVGVASVTLVAAGVWAFQDGMVGSLLGRAVSVQVRGLDLVAAAGVLLFGLLGTVDVMYLNVRERAAEFATLRAIGWPEGALGRLVLYEAAGIGLLGAAAGALTGAGAAALLVGRLDGRVAAVACGAGAAALLLATLAGLAPAVLLRRLPTARLLTEE